METLKRAAEDLDKSYDLNPGTSLSKVDCSLPLQNLFPVLHKEWFIKLNLHFHHLCPIHTVKATVLLLSEFPVEYC